MEAIESGDYYLNLHIATGRKAYIPRAGDLLLNGTRQEMTALKYEAMARTEAPKPNHWKRFDLEVGLNGLVHRLSNLSGAPAVIPTPFALATAKSAPITPPLAAKGTFLPPKSAKTSPAALASCTGRMSSLFAFDRGEEVSGNLFDKSDVASKMEELKLVESGMGMMGKGEKVETVEHVEDVDTKQTS